MSQEEVLPIGPEKITITLEKKTILKFYIRLYFFLNHKLRQLNEKVNSSGSQGFSKQQKKTILEQYFDEDINNINRLTSSADMFFIKPYFEHLCNNSYDDDCNNYRKYLNKMINYEDDPDEISEQIVEQVRGYANKFDSLSLNDQFIEKIRKMLANKNQLSKEDFHTFSKYMEGFLKESGRKQLEHDIQDLDKQLEDINAEYEAKNTELDSILKKIEETFTDKMKKKKEKEEEIVKEQAEIVKLKDNLKEAETAGNTELVSIISFRIRDKEKRIDEYIKQRETIENEINELTEDKDKKKEEIDSKIKNLSEMQKKDVEELEKKKENKHKATANVLVDENDPEKKIQKILTLENISLVSDEQKQQIKNMDVPNLFQYIKKILSNKPQIGGGFWETFSLITIANSQSAVVAAAIKSGIGGLIAGFGLVASVLSHNNNWTTISEDQPSEKTLNIAELTLLDHILRDIYDDKCVKIVDEAGRKSYLKKVEPMLEPDQIEETWHQITCIVNNLNDIIELNDDLLYKELPAISLNLSSLPSFKNNSTNLKKVIQLIIVKLHLNYPDNININYDNNKFIESYVKPIKDNIKKSFTNGFKQYLKTPDQTLEKNIDTKTHIYRGLNKENIVERLVRFFTYKYIKPDQGNFDYCIAFFKFLKNNKYKLFNEVNIIDKDKLNAILQENSSDFQVSETFEEDLKRRLNEILYDNIDKLEKKLMEKKPAQADGTLNSSPQAGELVIRMKSTPDMKLGLIFRKPDDYPTLRMADGTVPCVLERTEPGSISETFLEAGDRILAINGKPCTGPMAAAKQLQELVGNFNVLRASPPSSDVSAKAAPAL